MGPQLRSLLLEIQKTTGEDARVFPFGSTLEDRCQEILRDAAGQLGGAVRDMRFFHALRHYFRTQHMRQGTPDHVRDALTGHARNRRNAGNVYDHVDMTDMRKAVASVRL